MRRHRTISLALFLLLPLTVFLLASACLVFWMTHSSGRQAAVQLTERLRAQSAATVFRAVGEFLKEPEELVELNRRWLEDGLVSPARREALAELFLTQIRSCRTLTFISYGSADGWFVGANRNPETGEILLVRSDGPGRAIETYHVDHDNRPTALLASTPGYDPRLRPWYVSARDQDRAQPARWYPVFAYAMYPRLGIGLAAPVHDAGGKLAGVLAFDLGIGQIAGFLAKLPVGKTGLSAVVEADGQLIASSFRDSELLGADGQVRRQTIAQTSHPLLRAAWDGWMAQGTGDRANHGRFGVAAGGAELLVDWLRLKRPGALDLLVLTVLPTADYLADFDRAGLQTFLLILLVALACAMLVFLVTRRILEPIRTLQLQASGAAAGTAGRFGLKSPIREIDGLSRALAGMTRDLLAAREQLEIIMSQRNAELLDVRNRMGLSSFTAASIAHEVRGPLGNGLLAASRLDTLSKDMRRSLEDKSVTQSALDQFISECSETALIIQRNLARSADIARGFQTLLVDQMGETARDIQVQDYLDQIIFSMKPLLRKEGIVLKCDWGPPVSLTIDPGLLSHTIANLIQNAINHAFNPAQDREKILSLQVRASDSLVCLQFGDNGSGMDAGILEKIFDPLFTTRRGSGGSGLGLALIKHLIEEKAHGTITAESVPGTGTTFRITFPKAVPASGQGDGG